MVLYLPMNKTVVFRFLFLIFCGSLLHAKPKDSLTRQQPKNVVIILVDDLRPMLGSYGNSFIQTPHMDRLAQEGIQFNRAYANVPVCGASRASLLTGIRPTKTRFIKASSSVDKESPSLLTFPALLKSYGYTTISNGKVSHSPKDAVHGWNEIWSPKAPNTWRDYALPENNTALKEKKPVPAFEAAPVLDTDYFDGKTAVKSIEDIKKLHKEKKPFLVVAGLRKPHLPFNAPKKYWDLYDVESVPIPKNNTFPKATPSVLKPWYELPFYKDIEKGKPISTALTKTLIHGYAACVSYVDAQVGKILATLDALQIRDETLVILTSDHGFSLSEHSRWTKHALFEVELKIPLIIRAPGYPKNRQSNSLAELVDVFPTLCEVLNLPKPKQIQGNSLVQAMENPESIFKEQAYARWKDGETLITNRYFYSEWQNKNGQITDRMLFDHDNDPLETKNIVGIPRMQKTVDSLQKLLHQHINQR